MPNIKKITCTYYVADGDAEEAKDELLEAFRNLDVPMYQMAGPQITDVDVATLDPEIIGYFEAIQ